MHPNAIQYIQSYNENEVYQEMEKITGIHIDFIHPASGQEKEQFGIMIAAGDLPDIIGAADNYAGGEFRGVGDGAFVDLAPYLEQNAPDYYNLINSDNELKREVTGDEGVIAAFYRIKPVQDPPWSRPILRQDWLKELNIEVPRTIVDYEDLFKALLKFIFGAEPLSNFDAYVNQLKELGIEETIKITQAAYDKYMGQ